MNKKIKYQTIVAYIQSKMDWSSEEVIRWAIWRADMLAFANTGSSITGVAWIKSERGPIPSFR